MKQFVEILGMRTSTPINPSLYDIEDYFEKYLKEYKKHPKTFTFFVKISDIIRIQMFIADETSFYVVIIGNQFEQGNIGENRNELALVITDSEYVNLKEFLND